MNHAQIYRPYDPIVSNCFLPECHIKLIILEPRGKGHTSWAGCHHLTYPASVLGLLAKALNFLWPLPHVPWLSPSPGTPKRFQTKQRMERGTPWDPASLNADALVDDGSLKPKCSARSLKPGLTWPRPKESSLRLLQPAKGTLNLVRALPRLTCQAIHLASLSQIGAGRFVVKMDINGSLSNAHGPQWYWFFW